MSGRRSVFFLGFAYWLFCFYLSSCTAKSSSRELSAEADSYLNLWIEGLSLNEVKWKEFFQSPKFSDYEKKIGEKGNSLLKNRLILIDSIPFFVTVKNEDNTKLSDEDLLILLTNLSVAIEQSNLDHAYNLIQQCNLEEKAPRNCLEFFHVYLKAKWNDLLGNHFKSYNYLQLCSEYVTDKATPNIKTIFATAMLKCGRKAGITSQIIYETGDLLSEEANKEFISKYYLEKALSHIDCGQAKPNIDSLFTRSLYSSYKFGSLQVEDVHPFNEYVLWKETIDDTEQLSTKINSLCDTAALRILHQIKTPRIIELFYHIIRLNEQKNVNINSEILNFARSIFDNNSRVNGLYYAKYHALNLTNQNAEEELTSYIENFDLSSDFYSDAHLKSDELIIKAFQNIQGRKTRANVKIRGLSEATMRALGLTDLANLNSESTLDVPSLRSMNSLIQQASSFSLFNNFSTVDPGKIDQLVETFLKESVLSFKKNKNDSIVNLCLQAIQAQVNAHVPNPVDNRIRFSYNDEDYSKYLRLKSKCLISERVYENETRAGSAEELRNARREFIDFIVSKDKLAAPSIIASEQWNLKNSSNKNVMIYYSGENSAFLMAKVGDIVDLHEIELKKDFTQDIQFVLNKGFDLNSITNQPEVNSRLYQVCSDWHELFVQKYWPTHGEEVVILPIGNFAFVNWEGLNTKQDGSYSPLIYNYEISYQTDIVSLFKKEQLPDSPIQMAGFTTESYPEIPLDFNASGDVTNSIKLSQLTGAIEEVNNVCELFEGKAFTSSTPTVFLESLDEYNVLLVSTHGIVLPSKTRSSTSLVFSPNEQGQYLIHADDFLERRVNANLIAIPSCNSALGASTPNGGLKGLSGSVLNSGASAVVASLIELPDKASAEIISSFFKYLSQGMKKSTALRKAKLDYLELYSGAKKHPVFWSGLLLMGENSPLLSDISDIRLDDENFNIQYWWFIILFILIFFITLTLKRKKAI